MPAGRKPAIDYALITHFHGDHYGVIGPNSPVTNKGTYLLSGITDVADQLPIGTLLDRGYPYYNYPVDLKKYYRNDATFSNYLKFVHTQTAAGNMKVAGLEAGSIRQIRLLRDSAAFPTYYVRNVKSNGLIWNGENNGTTSCIDSVEVLEGGKFNENPLSNAILVRFGLFSFYTGGDNTGYEGGLYQGRKDVETMMASVIGKT